MHESVEHWRVHKPVATGENGVVAAQHWRAAQAGAAVLDTGGNAVDAAVATALAEGVVEPWMCGLGGSGYMVVYRQVDQSVHTLNFQGTVPAGIDLADYPLDPSVPDAIMGFPGVKDNRNVVGYGSITVPGAVAGFAEALVRFGSQPFERLVMPALDLASQGLAVDWYTTLQIVLQMGELQKDRGASELYLPGGVPAQPDSVLPLPALTATLKRLAEHGPRDFYEGGIAEQLVADLQRGGSAIGREDLANYRVEVSEPLSGVHRGVRVYGTDATGGARRLLEALAHSAGELDPTEIGADTYLAYARALDAAFSAHKARVGQDAQGGCTTHLSVLDGEGNLVALTYTLLNRFGSQVVLPRTGITMNNAISYFDPRPGFPTSLAGGKRINSSNMCPTIAVKDGKGWFAVGASGANFIVPATFQITALLIDYGLSLEEVFHVPRIDASARGGLRVDPRIPWEIREKLAEHWPLEVAQLLTFPKLYACPSAVLRDPDSGVGYGMTDPSSPVAAAWAG